MRVFLCLILVFLLVVPVFANGYDGDFSLVSGDPLDLTASDGSVTVLATNPITPSETSGLKAVLLELLGDYDAVIVEYTSGNYTSREVFQDDVWLCSFWLLAIIVYCLFRMIGGWLVSKR